MNLHLCVGMPHRTRPFTCILCLYRHAATYQIERLQRTTRHLVQCLLTYAERLEVLPCNHQIVTLCFQRTKVDDSTFFLRKRRGDYTQHVWLLGLQARLCIQDLYL